MARYLGGRVDMMKSPLRLIERRPRGEARAAGEERNGSVGAGILFGRVQFVELPSGD
jgi:hypothetical protein